MSSTDSKNPNTPLKSEQLRKRQGIVFYSETLRGYRLIWIVLCSLTLTLGLTCVMTIRVPSSQTQKGPRARRKSQSAESAPELTQAVRAINSFKCAFLDCTSYHPSSSCIHIFLLQTPKDVNHGSTGAGHGLKRLKQTHSSSLGW